MTKTLQLSAIIVGTILVAGLVAISISDVAFAKEKPETKKLLVQVRDQAGQPVPGAFCSLFPLSPGPFQFVQANEGGIVKITVNPDDPLNLTCIDTIDFDIGPPPFNAQVTFFNIELKDNGTTVILATLIPVP